MMSIRRLSDFIRLNVNRHKKNRESASNQIDRRDLDEPYINPDPITIFVRFGGKGYKFAADGIPYRFDPPSTKKPRKKTEPSKKTEA